MSSLPSQNTNLFVGSLTYCFCLRRDTFSLGVSNPASTAETPLTNTEQTFVFSSRVELWNIPLGGVPVSDGPCFHERKSFVPSPSRSVWPLPTVTIV